MTKTNKFGIKSVSQIAEIDMPIPGIETPLRLKCRPANWNANPDYMIKVLASKGEEIADDKKFADMSGPEREARLKANRLKTANEFFETVVVGWEGVEGLEFNEKNWMELATMEEWGQTHWSQFVSYVSNIQNFEKTIPWEEMGKK